MGFQDEIAEELSRRIKKPGKSLENMLPSFGDKAEQQAFLAALDNPQISISVILAVLKKRGVVIGDSTIRKWRIERRA